MTLENYFVRIVRGNGHIDSAYTEESAADVLAAARNAQALEAERRARTEGRIISKKVWTTETVRLYRPGDERP